MGPGEVAGRCCVWVHFLSLQDSDFLLGSARIGLDDPILLGVWRV